MMSSERIWRDLLASEARIQRSVAEGMRREGLSDDLAGARELLAERLELMALEDATYLDARPSDVSPEGDCLRGAL